MCEIQKRILNSFLFSLINLSLFKFFLFLKKKRGKALVEKHIKVEIEKKRERVSWFAQYILYW